ncbi:hypothetical protein P154DRAFT_612408 [Amniculicola lignicola CBS 123094]|uniref:Uncharacterized protein n=1 Tax=Amniculicola lignicola CBS 123094 TaxID=1392246 RepID=A0A6A5W224_9PLEO|nr:hypothetical protein P154DRAFT_612408 [Amniculicola lignicola CBS 123094]
MASNFYPSRATSIHLLTLLTICTTLLTTTHGMCYAPNGTAQVNDEGAKPCSSDPTNPLHTICCHTNWKNPPGADLKYGSTQDECLPNGLCQNRGFSTEEGKEQEPYIRYYRVYCTNQDWDTGECLDVCSTDGNAGVTAQITPCDGTNSSTTWCCGNTTACCTPSFNPDAIGINRVFRGVTNLTISSSSSFVASQSSTSTSSSIYSSTSTPSSTPFSSSTPTPTPANEKSTKLSGGAIGGISIAVIAGAAVMFGLGFFLARRKSTLAQKGENRQLWHGHGIKSESAQSKDVYSYYLASREHVPHELETNGPFSEHELETNGPLPEVPGESVDGSPWPR